MKYEIIYADPAWKFGDRLRSSKLKDDGKMDYREIERHYDTMTINEMCNFPINDIGRVLNQPTYFLNKFINSVRNFSDKRLQQILEIIYKLDYESKTCGEDFVRLSLQSFIFEIKSLNN